MSRISWQMCDIFEVSNCIRDRRSSLERDYEEVRTISTIVPIQRREKRVGIKVLIREGVSLAISFLPCVHSFNPFLLSCFLISPCPHLKHCFTFTFTYPFIQDSHQWRTNKYNVTAIFEGTLKWLSNFSAFQVGFK